MGPRMPPTGAPPGWFCLSGFNDGWEKGKGRMWLARRQPLAGVGAYAPQATASCRNSLFLGHLVRQGLGKGGSLRKFSKNKARERHTMVI